MSRYAKRKPAGTFQVIEIVGKDPERVKLIEKFASRDVKRDMVQLPLFWDFYQPAYEDFA